MKTKQTINSDWFSRIKFKQYKDFRNFIDKIIKNRETAFSFSIIQNDSENEFEILIDKRVWEENKYNIMIELRNIEGEII
jgi:hypothetical protein